jgi:penicillin amidase
MADTGSIVDRQTLAVAGLEAPAEILVDPWGIAHIYAGSVRDAFFVQGFNIARDRLWQLDLWRKRGLGRLAESFGPAYVAHDRAARLFRYRGDMDAEWAAYGPDAKGWTQAFVEGLNAYVGLVQGGAAPLPMEFTLSGASPDLWTADELVSIRSHGLIRNLENEVARARVVAAGGLAADRLRRKLEPDHQLAIPDGLDPADVPADVMDDYLLATKEFTFAPAAADQRRATIAEAAEGSNNWVIGPSRTATGRPILADDPHRVLQAPSIRYVVHLEAPGLSLIGAGEPHLPGVTIGHNGQIAIGITIFPADQEDLYVYELKPDDPTHYRYDGGWEAMRVVRETVVVKGEAPREVELAFTRHGPVLNLDAEKRRAFALRTIWSEPGASSYFGAARYQRAQDWGQFREALSHWVGASMNFVYADVAGNIGWQSAGKIPRRRNFDGLMPAPGDGRYEWEGFLGADELPWLYNPAKGYIATANEMNLPPGYPAEETKISFEWADPSRSSRIEAVLAADDRATVEASAALQMDDASAAALRAVALLEGLSSTDPEVARALGLVRAWDGHLSEKSAAAAIAEVWLTKHLTPRAIAKLTPATSGVAAGAGAPYAVTSYLAQAKLGDAERADILIGSLRSALDEIAERLGGDMAAWSWGALHQAHFVPAAAAFADAATRARMAHGPRPVRGSATTPCAATYRPEDFAPITGASFRMVVDVGGWDRSLVINSPGQSGDPASPHYGDLFPLWAEGQFVPMLYSRAAVVEAARQVIALTPG